MGVIMQMAEAIREVEGLAQGKTADKR